MTTRLTLDIVVTPEKTLVRPFYNLAFKYKQYPRSYKWDGILAKYVADHGYRLKNYTEVSVTKGKRHYAVEVEVLSLPTGGIKKVKKSVNKGLDIFQEI